MVFRNWTLGLAAALGLAFSGLSTAPLAAQGASQEFSIGDDRFAFDLPEGFCVPSGAQAAISEQLAAGDSANDTPVDIQKCGTFGEQYILIKTPRGMPPIPVTRAQFLQAVQAEFTNNPEAIDQGTEQGANDLEETLNNEVAVDEMAIKPAGIDETCAYLIGRVLLSNNEGESVTMLIGSCGSLVGQRHMFIHSYAAEGQGVSIEDLRARSKALMLAIRPL